MAQPGPLILLVDDDELIQEMLRAFLESDGYRVRSAYRGAEALMQVDALRPSLVLLDVRLPDIGGFDVCQQIKQRYPMLPVIIISGLDGEQERSQATQVGAEALLAKNTGGRAILEAVRALLMSS